VLRRVTSLEPGKVASTSAKTSSACRSFSDLGNNAPRGCEHLDTLFRKAPD
jgi:hypothetical protein